MSNKFDWSKVPKDADGFVRLSDIPQAQIRAMLSEAELVKLKEELKALKKRSELFKAPAREAKLNTRIKKLEWLIKSFMDIKG